MIVISEVICNTILSTTFLHIVYLRINVHVETQMIVYETLTECVNKSSLYDRSTYVTANSKNQLFNFQTNLVINNYKIYMYWGRHLIKKNFNAYSYTHATSKFEISGLHYKILTLLFFYLLGYIYQMAIICFIFSSTSCTSGL